MAPFTWYRVLVALHRPHTHLQGRRQGKELGPYPLTSTPPTIGVRLAPVLSLGLLHSLSGVRVRYAMRGAPLLCMLVLSVRFVTFDKLAIHTQGLVFRSVLIQ